MALMIEALFISQGTWEHIKSSVYCLVYAVGINCYRCISTWYIDTMA